MAASRISGAQPAKIADSYILSNDFMATEAFRTYMCVVCGLIYDEAAGWPEDGIKAGTRWADVPESWVCPDCGVGKADFEMVEVG